jgi:hypothetical protein
MLLRMNHLTTRWNYLENLELYFSPVKTSNYALRSPMGKQQGSGYTSIITNPNPLKMEA